MTLENARFPQIADKAALERGDTFAPRFDDHGLIPAIVTDALDGSVLMFAWMNAETLALTLSTGVAHFWSRSRGRVWRKGEESGNELAIAQMLTDCDQDVIWMRVTIAGAGRACHTGERSCFYRQVDVHSDGSASLSPVAGSDLSRHSG